MVSECVLTSTGRVKLRTTVLYFDLSLYLVGGRKSGNTK